MIFPYSNDNLTFSLVVNDFHVLEVGNSNFSFYFFGLEILEKATNLLHMTVTGETSLLNSL